MDDEGKFMNVKLKQDPIWVIQSDYKKKKRK